MLSKAAVQLICFSQKGRGPCADLSVLPCRQLAAPIHRGRAAPAPAQAQEGAGDGSRKRASDEAWDISRMAPKLRALKA